MNKLNRIHALSFARTQVPKEACGLVILENGIEIFIPCRNISIYPDMFQIHPDDFAKAEDRGEVIEIFHSHPFGSPRPSMVDLKACETTQLKWSIVSVQNGDWFEFQPSNYRPPLLGRQWAHGQMDCYSLLQDYYAEKLAIDLPDFERQADWWLKGDDLYAKNFADCGFRKVDDLKEHDIILMQLRSPVVNHGAVFIGDGLILHHLYRKLSSRDVYAGFYRKHTAVIVRHHSL